MTDDNTNTEVAVTEETVPLPPMKLSHKDHGFPTDYHVYKLRGTLEENLAYAGTLGLTSDYYVIQWEDYCKMACAELLAVDGLHITEILE